jgi:hypothetical protein
MSSYNSPLPVGSPEGTGAAQLAIAETPGGTNNNGNATDSAGNVKVDFVWGNYPMQPNDVRTDGTPVATVAADASQNYDWSGYSEYPSARLDAALDNHANVEAQWSGFPTYLPGAANYKVTAASGNGTTVTYTSQNKLAAGDVVNITGLTASAYNLSSATVASADSLKFTVTNAANVGEITGQWYGKVEPTDALTAYDGAGIGFIVVPSVLGDTTALALDELKDAGYEAANITTASAAANARTDVTRFNATSTTAAVIFSTNAHTNYPTGTKVTLVAGTPAGEDPVNLPAYAIGTWTVTGSAGAGQITVSGSGFTVADTTGINSTANLAGLAGTIKTQSTAAGTGSVLTTATITITPWATAS